ncbi:DUF6266 family protein [Olivibacter sp. CPCC 100613]|uniref:DUF6266 family protein n=1 Tax=Olivibacter sp. CPCC 100613 TaxID=3079931 RepID=UPI002FFC97E2
MAIAKNGINGKFSGKVGSIIGYQLGDQNVIRTVGERRKPFSPLEILNQKKMKVVSNFLAPIRPFIKFGFRREVEKGSRVGAFQLAQSYTRKYAIDIDPEGEPFVNPEKVLISKGAVDPPHRCTVLREGNQITLQWESAKSGGDHRLTVFLYDTNMYREFRELGAQREEEREVWEQSNLHSANGPIHVYAAFRNLLTEEISDSVYCGVI